MSTLTQLLSSRVRAALFQLLFGLRHLEAHIRELARLSGLHESTIRQELKKLKGLGLIDERRDSNRVYYKANRNHPLYLDIHHLVIKTDGLIEVFAETLKQKDIRIAFIFGSVAQAKEHADSDIDLMVIGQIGLRKLTSLLSNTCEQVGRDINPHVMTEVEYQRRVNLKDHFVTHVLDGPKLFIVGTKDDFEAMGK